MLEQAGFQKLVFEDFYDVLASLLQNIAQGTNDEKSLESKILLAFQSPESMFTSVARPRNIANF